MFNPICNNTLNSYLTVFDSLSNSNLNGYLAADDSCYSLDKIKKLNTKINYNYGFIDLNTLTEEEAYEKGKADGKRKKIQDAYDRGFKEGRGYNNPLGIRSVEPIL